MKGGRSFRKRNVELDESDDDKLCIISKRISVSSGLTFCDDENDSILTGGKRLFKKIKQAPGIAPLVDEMSSLLKQNSSATLSQGFCSAYSQEDMVSLRRDQLFSSQLRGEVKHRADIGNEISGEEAEILETMGNFVSFDSKRDISDNKRVSFKLGDSKECSDQSTPSSEDSIALIQSQRLVGDAKSRKSNTKLFLSSFHPSSSRVIDYADADADADSASWEDALAERAGIKKNSSRTHCIDEGLNSSPLRLAGFRAAAHSMDQESTHLGEQSVSQISSAVLKSSTAIRESVVVSQKGLSHIRSEGLTFAAALRDLHDDIQLGMKSLNLVQELRYLLADITGMIREKKVALMELCQQADAELQSVSDTFVQEFVSKQAIQNSDIVVSDWDTFHLDQAALMACDKDWSQRRDRCVAAVFNRIRDSLLALFADVKLELRTIDLLLSKLAQFRGDCPGSYQSSLIGLSLPTLLEIYPLVDLLPISLLHLPLSEKSMEEALGSCRSLLSNRYWYRLLLDYSLQSLPNESLSKYDLKLHCIEEISDESILPKVIQSSLSSRLIAIIDSALDPLSVDQCLCCAAWIEIVLEYDPPDDLMGLVAKSVLASFYRTFKSINYPSEAPRETLTLVELTQCSRIVEWSTILVVNAVRFEHLLHTSVLRKLIEDLCFSSNIIVVLKNIFYSMNKERIGACCHLMRLALQYLLSSKPKGSYSSLAIPLLLDLKDIEFDEYFCRGDNAVHIAQSLLSLL